MAPLHHYASRAMSKTAIVTEGRVTKLERGFARVQLDNGMIVLGHLSGRMRAAHIRLLPEDIVTIELSPYDLSRGRIVYRHKG